MFESVLTEADRQTIARIVRECATKNEWLIADVILFAGFRLPAVPVSGEIPEADATPDQAYDLGTVAGYDEAMREVHASGVLPVPVYEYAIQQTRDGRILTEDDDGATYDEFTVLEDLSGAGGNIPYVGVAVRRVVGPWLPVVSTSKEQNENDE